MGKKNNKAAKTNQQFTAPSNPPAPSASASTPTVTQKTPVTVKTNVEESDSSLSTITPNSDISYCVENFVSRSDFKLYKESAVEKFALRSEIQELSKQNSVIIDLKLINIRNWQAKCHCWS